jgi:signal transduction histidine kinase
MTAQTADETSAVDDELVQALIQAHGGRVWSVSQPDTGTTFHLTFPVDRDKAHSGGSPRMGDRRE